MRFSSFKNANFQHVDRVPPFCASISTRLFAHNDDDDNDGANIKKKTIWIISLRLSLSTLIYV